jgi:excisionase family DNA binding protein
MTAVRKNKNAGATTRTSRRSVVKLESGTYTLPQTAQRLGLGTSTVYDLVAREELPVPIHVIGGHKRTLVSEVEAYLAGSTRSA